MPYPNFDGKHGERALVTPEMSVAHHRKDPDPVPERVVLCFHEGLLAHVAEEYAVTELDLAWRDCYALDATDGGVAVVGGFGIGAPVAALTVEELCVRGGEAFLAVGTAGSLQPDLGVGDLVVASKALRDEGTSHHYRPPGEYAAASPTVRDRLTTVLEDAGEQPRVGPTWTIDAPYRETVPEIEHYRDEGVLTVDMEAAAVFAVARHREATAGALFTISDVLDPEGWEPAFDETGPHLENAFALAVDALAGLDE